jgi:hypothetical protein
LNSAQGEKTMNDRSRRVLAICGLTASACFVAACHQPAAPVAAASAAPAAAAAPQAPGDADQVLAFVKSFYVGDGPAMDDKTFDPSLTALIQEDAKLTPKGDEGALDSNPFCDCQDADGMQTQFIVKSVTPEAAVVVANLNFGGSRTDAVTYDLVKQPAGWRVHDISSSGIPSLRDLFVKSNAELAKGG